MTINAELTGKVIELGGGNNPRFRPNCDIAIFHDASGNQTVDFMADFNHTLPIQSGEWDGVFCQYALEHISYRNTLSFLKEVIRILKSSGKVVFVTADTNAQMQWIMNHPQGWDGKSFFESASCLLFGDQDYKGNFHSAFFSHTTVRDLFMGAGFDRVESAPHGARDTDLLIVAYKGADPDQTRKGEANQVDEMKSAVGHANVVDNPVGVWVDHQGRKTKEDPTHNPDLIHGLTREQAFDKQYFNGGGKVGGYSREGYRDFVQNQYQFQNIMYRRPTSVLEIGAARGYIGKRLENAGVGYCGLEISKHCYMTRCVDDIRVHDICKGDWSIVASSEETKYDLSYSCAVLEHIPEKHLPVVLAELKRTCRSHLHGIDFGGADDGFDKSHCTLKPPGWWKSLFSNHGLTNYEIIDKEDLSKNTNESMFKEYLEGDGCFKINVGSHLVQYHHGWINLDALDLGQFSHQNGYRFQRHDITQGLPYNTECVDKVHLSHVLEHLPYDGGLKLLREIRRILKPKTGGLRIAVPDAGMLQDLYSHNDRKDGAALRAFSEFDEINDEAAACPTAAGKLWCLLHNGHAAAYDEGTLLTLLSKAGFAAWRTEFRQAAHENTKQIVREGLDGFPCLSLYVDAVPA